MKYRAHVYTLRTNVGTLQLEPKEAYGSDFDTAVDEAYRSVHCGACARQPCVVPQGTPFHFAGGGRYHILITPTHTNRYLYLGLLSGGVVDRRVTWLTDILRIAMHWTVRL
jgi:hypothetical protein